MKEVRRRTMRPVRIQIGHKIATNESAEAQCGGAYAHEIGREFQRA